MCACYMNLSVTFSISYPSYDFPPAFEMLKPRGVLKFGFGRDVPLQNLKVHVDPYKYQFFKKKVTHSYTNRLKFGQILKNQPIQKPNFAFYKGSFIDQEADFATPVGGTFP